VGFSFLLLSLSRLPDLHIESNYLVEEMMKARSMKSACRRFTWAGMRRNKSSGEFAEGGNRFES
jgi:hypothetical protein